MQLNSNGCWGKVKSGQPTLVESKVSLDAGGLRIVKQMKVIKVIKIKLKEKQNKKLKIE